MNPKSLFVSNEPEKEVMRTPETRTPWCALHRTGYTATARHDDPR